MGFRVSHLYASPEVNPVNLKARSIPFFNPVDIYGRVFFFSWFGFMIAFWAWGTFPPLLTHIIQEDLQLSPAEVANSHIISPCAALLVRLVAGPLCDQFGPRKVFGGLLLVGAIPLGLAPLVHNASGLYVSRFFIGILGGAFVPCQVWSTGFFDKNVVGTANALTGGFGTAGGGITYFIMPAIYDAFMASGHTPSESWRLTFIVPLAMVLTMGIALLALCPDTPAGKWSERHLQTNTQDGTPSHNTTTTSSVIDVPGRITDKSPSPDLSSPTESKEKIPATPILDPEAQLPMMALGSSKAEVICKPTLREAVSVAVSSQAIFHLLTYMCSFGSELAINMVLSSYYVKNFPWLSQTSAATFAALFGFQNFVTRPLGGVVSDLLYNYCGRSLWLKKLWVVACGIAAGLLLVVIGQIDPRSEGTMFGLVAMAAVFLQAGNGANFSLVPHVHPSANGILSGLTGAGGNLGGVVFSVIFRSMDGGTNFAQGFWVIGVVNLVVCVGVSWIPPLPKGQVGGH
ncbi:Nitrate/nitrite transporter [Madurella fahalii]|uniref:Nitrate/nitrite transporter n=1 Tax=Madurella fahalii TaxID=1157608 RepID=A0ABQ0FZX4_9PEZI